MAVLMEELTIVVKLTRMSVVRVFIFKDTSPEHLPSVFPNTWATSLLKREAKRKNGQEG